MNPPRILFEDSELLVVDKPSGIMVHPLPGRAADSTLVGWLRSHVPGIKNIGDDPDRPGIVHRLDRDASGLMVIAKTNTAFEQLKKQFTDHTIKKEYAVLVHGAMPRDEGTITLTIGRSSNKRSRGKFVAKPTKSDGRRAVTHFVADRHTARYTLLTVNTETGRTHQIRAHFAAYGHPVVGDTEYGSKKWKDDAPRLFLHARRLSCTHPRTGEPMTWESPLPPELNDYLAAKHLV